MVSFSLILSLLLCQRLNPRSSFKLGNLSATEPLQPAALTLFSQTHACCCSEGGTLLPWVSGTASESQVCYVCDLFSRNAAGFVTRPLSIPKRDCPLLRGPSPTLRSIHHPTSLPCRALARQDTLVTSSWASGSEALTHRDYTAFRVTLQPERLGTRFICHGCWCTGPKLRCGQGS